MRYKRKPKKNQIVLRIRRIAASKGLDSVEIARKSKLNHGTVWHVLHGDTTACHYFSTIEKIVEALDCPWLPICATAPEAKNIIDFSPETRKKATK